MKMEEHMRTDLKRVPTMKIFDFAFFTKSIEGIVELTIGEPDFNTPEHVKEAGMAAIANNRTHYAPQRGTAGLLSAISDDVAKKVGKVYDPATEILVTNGVTEGAYAAVTAITNPGDVILVPTPTFSIYMADAAIAGGTAVEVDTSKTNFRLTPELIQSYLDEYGDRVKGLVVVNPTNPTGIAMNQDELDAIADVVRDKPIFVIADEIYDQLAYTEGADQYPSIVKSLPEQTILLNGFSKSYAMTGWRVAYMCAPKPITDELFKVHGFAVTDVATFVQDAAEEALRNGQEDPAAMRPSTGNAATSCIKGSRSWAGKPPIRRVPFTSLPRFRTTWNKTTRSSLTTWPKRRRSPSRQALTLAPVGKGTSASLTPPI